MTSSRDAARTSTWPFCALVAQSIASSLIEYVPEDPEIDPPTTATPPAAAQMSSAGATASWSIGFFAWRSARIALGSGTTLRNGDCWSPTCTTCRSEASNIASPVVLAKSATMTASPSLTTGGLLQPAAMMTTDKRVTARRFGTAK